MPVVYRYGCCHRTMSHLWQRDLKIEYIIIAFVAKLPPALIRWILLLLARRDK